MPDTAIDTENHARICRITCGWKKPDLPLDAVRRYWRDVHSPAIARRPGIWEYRHYQFDAVHPIFDLGEVDQTCPADEQLMWLSDVRYADGAALATFAAEPGDQVRGELLGDIDLIVDQSTTYKAVDEMAHTLVDRSALIPPQGRPSAPAFGLFLRSRTPEAEFRVFVRNLARRWTDAPGVLRLRYSLLEAPDVAAERAAGYPIKTHPPERQYQAWIDLALANEDVAKALPTAGLADHVRALHAYPVAANYTSNYAGKPTFVGLRGFPAWDALTAIGGYNQAQPAILGWMYGPVADGVTLEPVAR
ncbi:hypothetical protein M0208_08195 [Sphingomonas sp. SUN019]|uniref:hypothetical protein n=1 Tax=Sphingomonas sp. SUN019 TaxID=2937788 RepID=UPI0021646C39|nr:hypothetical protein [Sphingomonas sp. SUN019]UVO50498.1 hypothetical protein M0208_08195 [Sphingomonas sp. SUN019]